MAEIWAELSAEKTATSTSIAAFIFKESICTITISVMTTKAWKMIPVYVTKLAKSIIGMNVTHEKEKMDAKDSMPVATPIPIPAPTM